MCRECGRHGGNVENDNVEWEDTGKMRVGIVEGWHVALYKMTIAMSGSTGIDDS